MSTQTEPYVGMPITYTVGSDSYPALIIFVNPRTGRKFTFVDLSTEGIDSGHIYTERELVLMRKTPQEELNRTTASLRKDAKWRVMRSNIPVRLGEARFYRDPSF